MARLARVTMPESPTLDAERALWSRLGTVVAGVDEVGRGAWAGPVVAAAVVLPPTPSIAALLSGVRDSKAVAPAARERLAALVYRHALAVAVGMAPSDIVDEQGLLPATAQAMNEALAALDLSPHHALVDGLRMPGLAIPHTPLVRGDAHCLSIAAASIVAKVARDRLMAELDGVYDGYSFGSHKGYGTAAHYAALCRLGPCAIHRLSYAPIAAIVAQSWV